MDVLSDVIALMRTGQPTSALVRWHAPWGQRFPAVPGAAGFQVVLSGSCHLLPEDGGTTVELRAGDVLFMPHGNGYTLLDAPDSAVAEPSCDAVAGPGGGPVLVSDTVGEPGAGPVTVTLCGGYRLDAELAHPLLRELPAVVRLSGGPDGVPGVAEAVALLAREADPARAGLGADTLVPALLDVLLLYVLRAHYEHGGPGGGAGAGRGAGAGGWAGALADPGIGAALTAMHREPQRPWTVASLGTRAGMSRAAFARRFHDLVGRPPLAYLTWWRMTTAARLLRTTDAPLAALAAGSGYASEYAFAHAFKRAYGIPPGRYRAARPGGPFRSQH
ncbi:AraC family transcriptional regulator [Streptomyces sp. 4.24]|uniref:AraC family transcriptional regulator n=1 Tax=Streptomyces tritrimontium TaxID=3406573 RepID=UPI003BB80777